VKNNNVYEIKLKTNSFTHNFSLKIVYFRQQVLVLLEPSTGLTSMMSRVEVVFTTITYCLLPNTSMFGDIKYIKMLKYWIL
jgi:hypothetical protein